MTRSLLAFALAIFTLAASARTISPDEALSAALNTTTRLHRAPAARRYTLSQTFNDRHGTPAVYLFSGTDNAFLVTPADDCAGVTVLGYGIQNLSSDIPCNMRAWLEEYARQIEWLRSLPEDVARRQVYRGSPQRHNPVAPLCKTQWDQNAPYNNECPEIKGQRSATGCVATAMAQIMKVHRYPETGLGTKTHQWEQEGKKYTDFFDFGNTTFDWDNMLDTYSGSYTPEQAKAVATLMHACGVAAEMSYNYDESGTCEYMAGYGMIKHLRYSPTMMQVKASWYTTQEWFEMIYGEVEAGRPVLYNGASKPEEGHAFICDGYASDGFFHINWGWGGMSDGYYLLTMLDPIEQGIGGGSSAYVKYVTALVSIRPALDGDTLTPALVAEYFYTDEQQYTRNSETILQFHGGYANYALGELSYEVGLGMKGADGITTVLQNKEAFVMGMMEGTDSIIFAADEFPIGNYDVFPIYSLYGANDWDVMLGERYTSLALNLDVTETQITVSKARYEETPPTKYTVAINGVYPEDPEDQDQIIKRHTYSVSLSLMATQDTTVNLATLITRTSDTSTQVLAASETSTLSLRANVSEDIEQSITIPEDIEWGPAMFTAALLDADGNINETLTTRHLRIHDTFIKVTAEFVAITPVDPNDGETIYAGHTYDATFSVSSTGAEECKYLCGVADGGEKKELMQVGPFKLLFNGAGTQSVTARITLPEDYTGEANLVFMTTENVECRKAVPITIANPTGIATIAPDSGAKPEYFNLQGIKVSNPTPGSLLIRRHGMREEKVFVR